MVVHGTPADHTRWGPLLPYLEPHFTVHALDRRGRGGSGDSPDYALEREFEDVVAVVDAVAAEWDTPVMLYGHSHGGVVALGAAARTSNIRRLVLYEGWHVPDPAIYALPEALEVRMDSLLADGDRDGVVEALFRGLEDMSDEDMAAFKAAPSWAGRVAAAHTITREVRGELTAWLDPVMAGSVTVPVLLVAGENSADASKSEMKSVATALPNARILVLEGQEHVADVLHPEAFAAHKWSIHGQRRLTSACRDGVRSGAFLRRRLAGFAEVSRASLTVSQLQQFCKLDERRPHERGGSGGFSQGR